MNRELIRPDDPRWRAALARLPHDIYHTPEYVRFSAEHEDGEPAAFYAGAAGAELLAPVVLRPLPEWVDAPAGRRDAISPYGYPAPLMSAGVDACTAAALLSALGAAGREAGIVSAFFRLHPLLELPAAALEEHGVLVRHGQTVYVKLDEPLDQLRRGVRSGHAYETRRLARLGFRAAVDDWSLFGRFVEVYRETMMRVSADESYLFADSYFAGLRAALGDAGHLCAVLSPDGDVAAACLFSTTGGIAQYLFSGTAGEYLRLAPTKLLLDAAIEWTHGQGARAFHLGGGVGGREDSLFLFKAGFSRLRSDFMSYRMVLDAEAFADLCRQWSAAAGSPAAAGGFFPPYRAPVRGTSLSGAPESR